MHDLVSCVSIYAVMVANSVLCMYVEGSLDHEIEDAQAFASWGVDYLKYDNCYHKGRFGTPQISYNRYEVMWKAINATGRPILYSLCNWGEDYVHTVRSSPLNYSLLNIHLTIHTIHNIQLLQKS